MIGKIDARRYGEAAVEVRRRVSSSNTHNQIAKEMTRLQRVHMVTGGPFLLSARQQTLSTSDIGRLDFAS